jgi:hypothetical protein
MIPALAATVYAVGLIAGVLLGDAPQQAAAVLVVLVLGTHLLARQHRAQHGPSATGGGGS